MLKRTKQKEAILRVLRSTNTHPAVLWIYDGAREELPHISLATVYRNLRQLRDRGEILELQFDNGPSRFETRTDPHNHFICDECGRIYDVDGPPGQELNGRVARATGFQVSYYWLVFHGDCQACQKANR